MTDIDPRLVPADDREVVLVYNEEDRNRDGIVQYVAFWLTPQEWKPDGIAAQVFRGNPDVAARRWEQPFGDRPAMRVRREREAVR